jgi:hypothetical protein
MDTYALVRIYILVIQNDQKPTNIVYCIDRLAECPQCYCWEIRQMLTFLINLYCLKACYKPDHSTRIVEYHIKKYYFP